MPKPPTRPIRVALVGIGNCASSLVQGLQHYRQGANDLTGLLHAEIGGYRPADIHVVAAWDVDRRKVGFTVPLDAWAGIGSPSPPSPPFAVPPGP